jgi:hypothetical protein
MISPLQRRLRLAQELIALRAARGCSSVVAVDTVTDDLTLTDKSDVYRYLELYRKLEEAALSPSDSLDFLAATAEDIRKGLRHG